MARRGAGPFGISTAIACASSLRVGRPARPEAALTLARASEAARTRKAGGPAIGGKSSSGGASMSGASAVASIDLRSCAWRRQISAGAHTLRLVSDCDKTNCK